MADYWRICRRCLSRSWIRLAPSLTPAQQQRILRRDYCPMCKRRTWPGRRVVRRVKHLPNFGQPHRALTGA